jgi:hypothetical protein
MAGRPVGAKGCHDPEIAHEVRKSLYGEGLAVLSGSGQGSWWLHQPSNDRGRLLNNGKPIAPPSDHSRHDQDPRRIHPRVDRRNDPGLRSSGNFEPAAAPAVPRTGLPGRQCAVHHLEAETAAWRAGTPQRRKVRSLMNKQSLACIETMNIRSIDDDLKVRLHLRAGFSAGPTRSACLLDANRSRVDCGVPIIDTWSASGVHPQLRQTPGEQARVEPPRLVVRSTGLRVASAPARQPDPRGRRTPAGPRPGPPTAPAAGRRWWLPSP